MSTTSKERAPRWVSYDFAVLRIVPHVYVGAFIPVGVMVHARTEEFLAMRAIEDIDALRARVPEVDHELLARYLRAARAVAEGDPSAGPVALAPPSERFHWLTAPRSDVIQSSPIHEGLCQDPRTALDELYDRFVAIG